MAKEPKAAAANTLEDDAVYAVSLNKPITFAKKLLRPGQKHQFRGELLKQLDSAYEGAFDLGSAEKVG